MGELIAYGNEITNVFQLMGKLENDITKSELLYHHRS